MCFKNCRVWPFAHKLKGKLTIKLAELKYKSTVEENFKVDLESKRTIPYYFVSIKIREPCVEKEYKNVSKPVLTITKTYPPFSIDDNEIIDTNNIDNTSNSYNKTNIVKKEPKIIEKNTNNKPVVNNNNKSNPQANTNKKVIDKSMFTNEELEDPNNIDMLNTIKVLELNLVKVEKDIQKVEGRIPPKLRQRKLGISVKKNQITQATQNGDITINDYLAIAKNQLKKDYNLMLYFEQIGDSIKKDIVFERINVLKKEIIEGESFLKSGS